jgi:hypothetical protein
MEDLSKGTKRLTKELRALQPRLEWSAFQASSPGDQNRTLDVLLDAGLGEDLKRAVDTLRHFLWCYIESAAADSNPHVDYAQQSKRLEQITAVLRQLNHPTCPPKASMEFVARATLSVNRRMESHQAQEELPLEQPA